MCSFSVCAFHTICTNFPSHCETRQAIYYMSFATSPLISQFSAIDTILSLHFSTSTTVPKLHNVCARATSLSKTRISRSTIEQILSIQPGAYTIVDVGAGDEYGITVPQNVSIANFAASIPGRKSRFSEQTKNAEPVPTSLATVAVPEWQSPHSSPQKRRKSALSESPLSSPTKSRSLSISPLKVSKVSDLRNSRPKFLLKPTLSSKLLLLERIRLKEQQALESADDSGKNYKLQIAYKMPVVYDVLYELTLARKLQSALMKFSSFTQDNIVSIVKDSTTLAVGDSEVNDVLQMLKELLPEKIQILQRNGISVVKVYDLDRAADLPCIRNSQTL